MMWKPYFLYSQGFKSNVWNYWKKFIPLLLVFTISAIVVNYINNLFVAESNITILTWCITAVKLSVIIIVVYGTLLYLSSKGFRDFVKRLVKLAQNIIHKN